MGEIQILVVEDEPALLKLTIGALRSCGHQVVGFETGSEALNCARSRHPGLVLLDLQLPDMDGREFLREFRSLPGCLNTPVVVMSAAHRVALSELHVEAFFAKPFDLDELLDRIDELLVAHPATQHNRADQR